MPPQIQKILRVKLRRNIQGRKMLFELGEAISIKGCKDFLYKPLCEKCKLRIICLTQYGGKTDLQHTRVYAGSTGSFYGRKIDGEMWRCGKSIIISRKDISVVNHHG